MGSRASVVTRVVLAFVGAGAAVLTTSRAARAADEDALMAAARLPAPFVLPTMQHDRLDLRVDSLVGSVGPQGSRGASAAGIFRTQLEGSILLPRQLYVGLGWAAGAALPPDGGLATNEVGAPSGMRALAGNVEGHVRAVFPLPEALQIGFVLAATAPTASYDRGSRPDRSAVDAFASLDPTNWVDFLDSRVALRPAGDLRVVRGDFQFQGRHGVDIAFDTTGRDSVMVAGRLMLHAGWLITRAVELSLEASQIYVFSSDPPAPPPGTPAATFASTYRIADGHRSAFTFGPALRWSSAHVDIGASLITNLWDPLTPIANHVWGINVSLIAHLGRPKPIEILE